VKRFQCFAGDEFLNIPSASTTAMTQADELGHFICGRTDPSGTIKHGLRENSTIFLSEWFYGLAAIQSSILGEFRPSWPGLK
jgi:hypothetical protein